MKKPTSIKLDDGDTWDTIETTVTFLGDNEDFILVRHDDPEYGDFYLTRNEARKLRNFLNKCLEW